MTNSGLLGPVCSRNGHKKQNLAPLHIRQARPGQGNKEKAQEPKSEYIGHRNWTWSDPYFGD